MNTNFHADIRVLDEVDLDKVTGGSAAVTSLMHDLIEAIQPFTPSYVHALDDVCPRTNC